MTPEVQPVRPHAEGLGAAAHSEFAEIAVPTGADDADAYDERVSDVAAFAAQVRGIIEKMDRRDGVVITMSYYLGLTHAQIARRLDLPERAVAQAASRGLLSLARELPAG